MRIGYGVAGKLCASAALAVVTVAGSALVAPVLAPASAAGAAPTILSPAENSLVPGAGMVVTVDFTGAAVGDYTVNIGCWPPVDPNSGYENPAVWTEHPTTTDLTTTLTWSFDAPSDANGDCVISATGPASTSFRFAMGKAPSLTIHNQTFYPLVRDDYKDFVDVVGFPCGNYLPNHCGKYEITDSHGKLVRSGHTLDPDLAKSGDPIVVPTARWNGKDAKNRTVNPGTYTMTVLVGYGRVVGGFSPTYAFRVPVTVATMQKKATTTTTLRRASSLRHKGNCYAKRISGETVLDCWAGTYAAATYRVPVPADAKVLIKRIVGEKACCARGTLTKKMSRPKPTLVKARVKVTGWRAYHIKKVVVRYRYLRTY